MKRNLRPGAHDPKWSQWANSQAQKHRELAYQEMGELVNLLNFDGNWRRLVISFAHKVDILTSEGVNPELTAEALCIHLEEKASLEEILMKNLK